MGMMRTLTINGTKYDVVPVVPSDSITLLADAWVGSGDVYSQVVDVPGVTPHTKVDLQPTSEQLGEFHYKVLAFVAENNFGVVTVYSVGDKPTGDHTIQITKTEVQGASPIRGNTVGTTTPRPDWNQTDPQKADYIRNKEAVNNHLAANNNPHGVTPEQIGARPNTWMPTADEVGARPNTWMPTADEVGAVKVSNSGEAVIVAGAGRETRYRLAVTTAGNLRIDSSADQGATWELFCYVPKTMNAGSLANPGMTSSGRAGVMTFNHGGSAANGAGLWLYGNDHSTKGKFRLQVYDEENNKYRQLDGSPDGSLKWNGQDVHVGNDAILTSPGGKKFKLTVADDGTLSTTEVT